MKSVYSAVRTESLNKARLERIKNKHKKGNNRSEKKAGHYGHHREEKAPVVWPC
jgi:hypothetical protein